MCFSIQLRGFFPQMMKFQRIGEIIFVLIDRTSLSLFDQDKLAVYLLTRAFLRTPN